VKALRVTSVGLRLAIGAGILVALIIVAQWAIGWRRLLEPWLTIAPSILISAVLLTLFSYVARMLRVYDYFLPATRGGLAACLKLTLLHNLFNNLLPMRTGETSFPMLMTRYFGTPFSESLAALLWFRLMDLHVLVAVALAGAGGYWLDGRLVVLLTALWVSLAWWLHRLQSGLSISTLARRLPPKWQIRLKQAHTGLPQSSIAFWRAWFWTLLNWLVKLGVFAWILQQFAPMPAAAALLGAIGGDLTSVLPVHGIAGAGTYEAGVVSALLAFHVPTKAALAAAVNLHLFMLGMSLMGGMLALPIRRDPFPGR
jgi:uncharacterized membrane protein YbhN (UPF0104 family)